ncbi:MAG: leucine-rich repeat protein, partial [Faecalibacterium sp.]|nr:leucine-rich repeat protein [Faecalibacterium sp.]
MKPKRLISLLVAVCMMITMLPLSAVTAFAFTVDTSWSHDPTASYNGYKYAYRVNDGNATITKFLGPVDSEGNVDSTIHGPYDIEIPSELGNCPVTGLGEYSFAGSSILDDNYSDPLCRNIHSVTIPQSVTFIGREAFFKCDGLQSLTINGAIVSMSYKAFGNCTSLTTLKLGEHIKTIGGDAFSGCSALKNVTIPENVTSIGSYAFAFSGLESLTINGAIESMGNEAFFKCENLKTLKLGEHIKTIGDSAFKECSQLREVTIPDSVTSIYSCAFCECTSLTTLSLGKNIEAIYENAFNGCSNLSTITIPEKVTTIYYGTFEDCSILKSITLPAGLTSFQDSLNGCPDDCAIYYNNYKTAADALLASNDALAERNFLYLCKVTFNANGGSLNDDADVPVYKTEKITKTEANDRDPINAPIHDPTRAGYTFTGWYTEKNQSENDQPFNVNETAITEDITLYAGWKFDPNALGCHPLTVTGGTVTVKYDGSDVTSTLNSRTDAATGQKTYDVPEGAKVTVKLDKNTVHNGKVFDGWSTGTLSLPTGQDYKAETITFPMSSGVDIAAQYRDAATDHTPDTDTAVCHPLTVTGGIVTVKKGDKDVTDTLTVTTDETTGKKTYSVPDGAEVTVTLDKTLIPEGMVFDIWSTGKFSLPLGQDYKAETITFTMSSDADIAAQYRDATIEDDGPNVLGTAAIIGTAAVGTAVLGYQAYSLGAEFAGKLMALPYFPSNRSALAMMLWEDAGKPMPES